MAFPQVKVTVYFQAITKRSIADAERILGDLKQKSASSEWSKGYMSALDGMLIAARSNDDQYSFISKINFAPEKIEELKSEFISHSKNKLHDDFDRGFFSAWTDYMRLLTKWEPPANILSKPQPQAEATSSAESGESEELIE